MTVPDNKPAPSGKPISGSKAAPEVTQSYGTNSRRWKRAKAGKSWMFSVKPRFGTIKLRRPDK